MSARIAVQFAFLVVFSPVLHAQTTTQTNAVGTAVSTASTAGGSAVTAAGSGLFTSTAAPIVVTPGISFGARSSGASPGNRQENVSQSLDLQPRSDMVNRPSPTDIRIQQPGMGVPRCFDASRDGQSC
jgi:hypothetical protein